MLRESHRHVSMSQVRLALASRQSGEFDVHDHDPPGMSDKVTVVQVRRVTLKPQNPEISPEFPDFPDFELRTPE